MADPDDNVVPLGRPTTTGGNGNGNSGWYISVERRLTKLTSDVNHLATKADVEAAMGTMLKWGIGLIVAVAGLLAVVLFRLLEWADRFIPAG